MEHAGRSGRWTILGVLAVLVVAALAVVHFTTTLEKDAVGWSLADEDVTAYSTHPWSCDDERGRRFICHELIGANVPFSVERDGRRCWRVRRIKTTQGGRAGTIAATGCYDAWDRLERAVGLGPSFEGL